MRFALPIGRICLSIEMSEGKGSLVEAFIGTPPFVIVTGSNTLMNEQTVDDGI